MLGNKQSLISHLASELDSPVNSEITVNRFRALKNLRPLFLLSGLIVVGILLLTLGTHFFGSPASAQIAPVSWLSTDGNRIVDSQGNTVILRGVNLERREWLWAGGTKCRTSATLRQFPQLRDSG